jgi:hypothetical protein
MGVLVVNDLCLLRVVCVADEVVWHDEDGSDDGEEVEEEEEVEGSDDEEGDSQAEGDEIERVDHSFVSQHDARLQELCADVRVQNVGMCLQQLHDRGC